MKTRSDVQLAVSSRVKAFLQSEGLSVVSMGEITGVHTNTIYRTMQGAFLPSLYTAYLIADAMGMTLDQLINPTQEDTTNVRNETVR